MGLAGTLEDELILEVELEESEAEESALEGL